MKYIKTLHIVNFQSHKNSIIDLDPGLNIFVGESDQGKTAIIRALRWLIYNEPLGTAFIRVGETCCSVSAILNDGTKVTRLRDESKNQNRYIINQPGKEELILERFKHEVPIEVQQELGIFPLWIDTDLKMELNIARQLDKAFLITESPAKRAKIIGRIANLHIIDAAQRDLLRDIRSLGRKNADLEEDITSLKSQLEEYQDLPQKEQELQQIKQELDKIKACKNQVHQLEGLQKRKEELSTRLEKNKEIIAKLHNLDEIIVQYQRMALTVSFHKKLSRYNTELKIIKADLSRHLITINKLDNLETITNKHLQCISLSNAYKELLSLQVRQRKNQAQLKQINKFLAATPNLPRAEEIIGMLYELRQTGSTLQQRRTTSRQLNLDISQKKQAIAKVNEKLKTLQEIDQAEYIIKQQVKNADKLAALKALNQQIGSTKQKIRQNFDKITALDEKYKKMQQKFTELLSEAGTCPTCGSTITPVVIKEIIKQELEGEEKVHEKGS